MDFLTSLPKIELHSHLSGSVPVSFLKELKPNEVQEEFEDLFDYFPQVQSILSSKDLLQKAVKRVISEFRKDGAVYLELRSSPRVGTDYSKEDYIRIIVSIIQEEEKTFPLITKLLISIDRSKAFEEAKENLDLFVKMSKEFPDTIVGLDISGNPTKGHMKPILDLIDSRRADKRFNVTVHCGEEPDPKEIEDIIRFKPDRIGHGVHVAPNAASHIPWEVCLTSNIITQIVPCYEKHLLKTLYERKIPFSISTDDPGLFKTSLSQEFGHLKSKVIPSISNLDIFRISQKSVDYIFSDESTKKKLRLLFENWEIENSHYLLK